MVEETATNGKVKELMSISIIPFPDWSGERIETDKRAGDGIHKYSISVPFSLDDEILKKYFKNMSLVNFVKMGIIQFLYGETSFTNSMKEMLAKGNAPDSEIVIETLTKEALHACSRELGRKALPRISKAEFEKTKAELEQEKQKTAAIEAAALDVGMSMEELIALAKKMKAKSNK